jgi:hypothetical protein
VPAGAPTPVPIVAGVVNQSEIVAVFALPTSTPAGKNVTFGVTVGVLDPPYFPANRSLVNVTALMNGTDLAGRTSAFDPVIDRTQLPQNSTWESCQKACDARSACAAWSASGLNTSAELPDAECQDPNGCQCVLLGEAMCPTPNPHAVSGAKMQSLRANCNPPKQPHYVRCSVNYAAPVASSRPQPFYDVDVSCGSVYVDSVPETQFHFPLRLMATETTVELRMFVDGTVVEAFFQQGRVALTVSALVDAASPVTLDAAGGDATATSLDIYPMRSIWTTPEAVLAAPRVYK